MTHQIKFNDCIYETKCRYYNLVENYLHLEGFGRVFTVIKGQATGAYINLQENKKLPLTFREVVRNIALVFSYIILLPFTIAALGIRSWQRAHRSLSENLCIVYANPTPPPTQTETAQTQTEEKEKNPGPTAQTTPPKEKEPDPTAQPCVFYNDFYEAMNRFQIFKFSPSMLKEKDALEWMRIKTTYERFIQAAKDTTDLYSLPYQIENKVHLIWVSKPKPQKTASSDTSKVNDSATPTDDNDPDSTAAAGETDPSDPAVDKQAQKPSGKLPEFVEKVKESWEKYHPNHTVKVWRDEDVTPLLGRLSTEFPHLDEAWKNARTAAEKADIARLAILYVEGGQYADTDLPCLHNTDIITKNVPFCVGLESNKSANIDPVGSINIGNAYIAARSGNPIIKRALSNLQPYSEGVNHTSLLTRTGPRLLTRETITGLRNNENPLVMPPVYFYPMPIEKKSGFHGWYCHDVSFAIHLWDGSWNGFSA
jgi:mannosyltransferase OCH1-like enzyme